MRLTNPYDPTSCLCCGEHNVRKRKAPKNPTAEDARIAIEDLESLGYTKEEMLGTFRAHLDWQAPGLAEWVRRSLS
jgi:hypothetical protein